MCTLILLRRPDHDWPLLLAANRDEMVDRPWQQPARHWSDRPQVVGGLDTLSGGSWLGLNDDGLVAGVLNRVGSLGPADDKRSRGELVLEALDHATATEAAEALADLDPRAYRSFNLVVADLEEAYWIANREDGRPVSVKPIADGLHMVTAHDLDDLSSPRQAHYLPRFEEAETPDPAGGDWSDWQRLLRDRGDADAQEGSGGLCIAAEGGFETVSSSLIAVPRPPHALDEALRKPVWLFAPARPDLTDYHAIEIEP